MLTNYFPIAEAISLLFYPHVEVIIHDLDSGLIAAIYNNFSKRKVGDESLLEELDDFQKLPDLFPPYQKINWDGRKLKSTTATLRNEAGKPIALLCLNLDLSKWDELHKFLGSWIQNIAPQPAILFKDDWREKINSFVSDYLKRENISLKQLSKEKKRELIITLHKEGAFKAKNAASYIADILDLSRATLYNYLR